MRQLIPILNVIGFVVALFSLTMLIPLAVSLYLDDEARNAFLFAITLGLGTGLGLFFFTQRQRRELQPRDGFLLVFLCWTVLPAIAAIPFFIYYFHVDAPIPITYAYFEAMSGLTTTGSTVLTGLDELPPSINVWRGTLIWIGGMGILVLAVAILPMLGVGAQQLFKAETPGPMKDEKLTPRITGTAKGLYSIYMGFSALCFLSYHLAGMSWLDAYMHMGSTMALGGFSSHDSSMAWFDSPLIDAVASVFMLIAGINFAAHFLVFRQRSVRPYLDNPETRIYLATVIGAAVFVSIYLYVEGTYTSWFDAFRYGIFNTISVATTTGLSNTDYLQWPVVLPVLMLMLSCFVTSAGSTGGGIKMIRLIIILKLVKRELGRLVHPRSVYLIRLGRRVVSDNVIASVQAFLTIYLLSVIVISVLLMLLGLDPISAFSATIACINSTGPGLGVIGPAENYSVLSHAQIWLCTFAMLIGRLEFFTVFVLFTRAFWHK